MNDGEKRRSQMPAAKAKAKKSKIKVRDLGAGAKKGLDKIALKKVRGGEMGVQAMAAGDYEARKKPKGCPYPGEKCTKLKFHLPGASTLLTVEIPTS
jgi:hypothetical protein